MMTPRFPFPDIVPERTVHRQAPPGPPPGIASFSTEHTNNIHFLLGDGSVRICSASVDPAVLNAALTGRGGEVFSGF
jgi:hypothetical protein